MSKDSNAINLISLIVPMFNTRNFVSDFITSLNNQTRKYFQVVFVDDGSTDETFDFVNNSIFHENIDVKIIKQPNQGAGVARWTGLHAATGPYVVFLDSDDWIRFDYIQIVTEAIQKKKPDALHYNFINFLEKEKIYKIKKQHHIKRGFIELSDALKKMYPVVWTTVYRKELLEALVGFPSKIHHEDWFKYYHLINCKCIYCIDTILYAYRLGREGASGDGLRNTHADLVEVVKKIIDLTRDSPLGELYKKSLIEKMSKISVQSSQSKPSTVSNSYWKKLHKKLIGKVKRMAQSYKHAALSKIFEYSRTPRN